MEDRENEKGSNDNDPQKEQPDANRKQAHLQNGDAGSASASSHTSESSIESTVTVRDDIEPLPISTDLSGAAFPFDSPNDPLAVTEMPAGYDPNRIPLLVFNSRSNNGRDWSVTSNESLFSIQMGNNSFSRDHAFLLYKSGELMKLDEVFSVPSAFPPVGERSGYEWASVSARMDMIEAEKPTSAVPSCDFFTEPLPPYPPTSGSSSGFEFQTPKAGPATPFKGSTKAADLPKFYVDKGAVPLKSPSHKEDIHRSLSTHSDGSATSTSSFAFPIFGVGDPKNASKKGETRKEQPDPSREKPQEQKHQSPIQEKDKEKPVKQSKGILSNWFSCFSCCSFRCSMCIQ